MQPQPRAFLLCLSSALILAPALACTDDTTAATTEAEAEASSSPTTSTTSDPDPSESDSSSEDPGESESGSETGEPDPDCGNGELDTGEECDDGNNEDGDGCSATCISACGAEFWLDINAELGWFDVQDMRSGEGSALQLAGGLEFEDDTPGRLRVANYEDSEFVSAIESEALGSAGTPMLPQTHEAQAVVISDQGDILALGTTTEVLVEGEDPVLRYWLGRYAASDLNQVWRVDLPAPPSEESNPLDLAVLANGDPVLTMTTEVADNDDDIRVVSRAFSDGAEVWSRDYSGEFESGWSLDLAGKIAVGSDGRLWTAGILRVDWQTYQTTLFELDPSDGALLWSDVPLPDPGNAHEQDVLDLAAGADGRVALAIGVRGPASMYSYGAAFMYDDRTLAWSLTPEDLPWDDGEPYLSPQVALDADGDVLIVGSYTHSFNFASAARPWITAFAPDGTQLCAARIGQGQDAGIVPSTGFFGGGRGAINVDTYGVGGMGPGSAGNWLVGVRGW